MSDIHTNERLSDMANATLLALRVTPESHIHPSIRTFFDDAEIVRRTLAVLPPNADPSQVHVVQFRTASKCGQTNLVSREFSAVYLGVRGSRSTTSRIVLGRKAKLTRTVTVVLGPHEGQPTVFTAYWGAAAPREPNDPTLDDASRTESIEFWDKHALVPEPGEQTVINLTPHTIQVAQPEDASGDRVWRTLPASGHVARVATQAKRLGTAVLGAPVESIGTGPVEGLPSAQEGVVFVVSGMVRSALGSTRPDVVSPGALVRDRDGVVIGCLAFVGVES